MKKLYTLFTVALMTVTVANAKTYVVGNGKWTDAAAWNGDYAGTTIKSDDIVIIVGQVTMNAPITVDGVLQVEKGASMMGMKDMIVSKSGMFVNNGNTVVKSIYNEGTVNNNLILETMQNFENKGGIENNNNIVTGNNLQNYGGKAGGKEGAYYINNSVLTSPSAQFGADVKIFTGNALETASTLNEGKL